MARYGHVNEWLDACRAVVAANFDNLILFTGPEGEGKSTLMFQVLSALDENFDANHAHFGIHNFLAHATPPADELTYAMRKRKFGNGHRAEAADELEANKRRGMYSQVVDLLDWLKDCRGLNLHIGMCFPHEDLFEGAILNFRVRWKVHVPQRGLFVIYERTVRKWRKRNGEETTIFTWQERGRFSFTSNSGARWAEYNAKKEAHMETLADKYRDARASPTGIVHEHAVSFFRQALDEYEQRRGGRGGIMES